MGSVNEEKKQLLKPCVQSADNQNRMRPKVHYGRSDMTCCALAVCFVYLQLALVCASLLSRAEGLDDVNSSLLG